MIYMNQKKKSLFKKIKGESNDKFPIQQDNPKQINQQEKTKKIIMEKFKVSDSEADVILNKLLKKRQPPNKQLNQNTNKLQRKKELEKTEKNINFNKVKFSEETKNSFKSHELTSKPDSNKKNIIDSNMEKNNNQEITNFEKQKSDVDSILIDIIPDYNKHISIEVEHINLTFEVETEKIDTLKESFIRTLKRTKTEKIKFHALKDISFKIYKGEKIGIIGYNGAGKSTLLKVICGIYQPDDGFVKTKGNISPLLSLGSGFDHNYSGRQNIILNGAVLGYDKEFLESKIDEIIEFSELGDFIDFPIKNYSSGMLAKLGFSIATIVNPDILVIDEILGLGDVNFSKKSSNKIKSLMDGGTTVLFVSHSIPQVREICDKAIWIDEGELREMGEVNKVCDNYLKHAEKASQEQIANMQLR